MLYWQDRQGLLICSQRREYGGMYSWWLNRVLIQGTVPFDCHRRESILKLRIMILSYQRIASESKKKFNSYLLFISFTSVVCYIKDITKFTCKTHREQKIHVPSNIILEAVLLLLCHKFYIQLALPISPEIMDGFWCSRCLKDHIKVPDMMRLFAGGATTPLVVKIWTKQP